jgi:hypothetical protein
VEGVHSLSGHVTEKMREHYSTVALDQQRMAVAQVVRLIPTVKVGTAGKAESRLRRIR